MLETILELLRNLLGTTMSDADLTAKLDELAEGKGLNWRVSLIDFLKLIGAETSLESRRELAEDLGVEGTPGEAGHNEALRKELFRQIAQNGGNIPSELID